MINDSFNVQEIKTGKVYQCVAQMIDLNNNGKYVLRYNIGINGYNEWSFIEAIYDNDEFNSKYEVVRWGAVSREWIPLHKYNSWEENPDILNDPDDPDQ